MLRLCRLPRRRDAGRGRRRRALRVARRLGCAAQLLLEFFSLFHGLFSQHRLGGSPEDALQQLFALFEGAAVAVAQPGARARGGRHESLRSVGFYTGTQCHFLYGAPRADPRDSSEGPRGTLAAPGLGSVRLQGAGLPHLACL